MKVFAGLTIFLASAVLYAECITWSQPAQKICVKPKGKNPGYWEMPASGKLLAVKLTHVAGTSVSCKESDPNAKTKWGCNIKGHHNRDLVDYVNMHVTDLDNVALFPTPNIQDGGYFKQPNKNANSDTLVFGNVLGPGATEVTKGQEIKIHYGEDLHKSPHHFKASDNSGETCMMAQAYIV